MSKTARKLLEYGADITISIIVAIIINTFIFGLSIVNGVSMEPTLRQGDILFTWRLLYAPKVGDIVATTEKNGANECLVKRVIALGGDTVDIINSEVYVNNEKYAYYEPRDITIPGDVTFPYTLQADEVFLMGDNRNESWDSRYSTLGKIKKSDITGKIVCKLCNISRKQ